MPILYDEKKRIFKLDAGDSTYSFCVTEDGYLLHLYYGKKISDTDTCYLLNRVGRSSFCPNPPTRDGSFSLDNLPQEYSCSGTGDYRISALSVLNSDGNTSTQMKYKSHRIFAGKPKSAGMPALWLHDDREAQTLELTMEDAVTGVEATLFYTAFRDENVFARSTVVTNRSGKPVSLRRAASCCVDFSSMDFDLLHLHGKWAQERQVSRLPLQFGIRTIASKRGSSSHNHNPFAALLSHDATEDCGEAFGFNLVYSGNFAIETEVDDFRSTRVVMGINPEEFAWRLEPGESFAAPEAVMVYSHEGIGGMSRTFHRVYREHLCRGEWAHKKRPLLINSWEAAYFDFDDEKLVSFAKSAAKLGVEMLVMDDGWFGRRSNDTSSLGDWQVNTNKIRCGLPELVRRVNKAGLQFGIWYEPEMVSPDSDLYRAHPQWALHVPGRESSIGRNQYVLDMSRSDVREYLFSEMSKVLASADIRYVKWDFNRNLTEIGSELLPAERQEETAHRYVLGLYELLDRLTAAFPHVLFEGCSGGGGRFDPGILYYCPQIWASDDTDALERVRIQYGTSVVYPVSSISSHVSACPNHQTGRTVSLETRGNAALFGTFGYELNPMRLTDAEKEQVKEQVRRYHAYYDLIHGGDLYRLLSPFENDWGAAYEFVSPARDEALATFICTRSRINENRYITLRGLAPDRIYRDEATGSEYHGDTLMNAGINISLVSCEGESILLHFTAIN